MYGNIVYLGRNTWEQISENMKYSPDSPNESRQATSNPFLRRTEKFSTEPEPEAMHKQNRRRGQPAGRQRMAKRRGRLAGSVNDIAIDCCRDNAFYRLTLARIRCFATFARTGATPLGVSKRSVVELCGKDQQIAVANTRD